MNFEQAAKAQYLRHSIYTVWLVSPDGKREQIGTTSRKTGTGLIRVIQRENVQKILTTIPGMETASFKKTASALLLSNGWKIEFGGTIRQEAN